MYQKSQGAQTVVQGDHHYALLREKGSVVLPLRRGTKVESPPVNPDHYRELGSGIRRGGPHVQGETVLVVRFFFPLPGLGTGGTEGAAVPE